MLKVSQLNLYCVVKTLSAIAIGKIYIELEWKNREKCIRAFTHFVSSFF